MTYCIDVVGVAVAATLVLASACPQQEGLVVHRVVLAPDGVTAVFGRFHNELGTGHIVLARDGLERALCEAGIVRGLAFMPDGKTFFATRDHGELWQIDLQGGRIRTIPLGRLPGFVRDVAVAPDGSRVAVIDDERRVQCFAVADGKLLWKVVVAGLPLSLVFLPTGVLAVTDNAGAMTIWSAKGEPGAQHTWSGKPMRLAVDPSGNLLAAGMWDGTVEVLDLRTGTIVQRPERRGRVQALCFGDGGKRLAIARTDDCVTQWELSKEPSEETTLAKAVSIGDLRCQDHTFLGVDYRGVVHRLRVKRGDGK